MDDEAIKLIIKKSEEIIELYYWVFIDLSDFDKLEDKYKPLCDFLKLV